MHVQILHIMCRVITPQAAHMSMKGRDHSLIISVLADIERFSVSVTLASA